MAIKKTVQKKVSRVKAKVTATVQPKIKIIADSGLEKKLKRGAREIKKLGGEIMDKATVLKKKYDNLDDDTKKKIIRGVVGAVAVIAGVRAISKSHKKKK